MASVTESASTYSSLDQIPIVDLLMIINQEDRSVPLAVEKVIPAISLLVEKTIEKLKTGGRLFYLGAGTSGRLGIVDASECPPTYGIAHGIVVGLIAGGDSAIRKAVENAEDDWTGGVRDLMANQVTSADVVVGIAASGRTPYVAGALEWCQKEGIITGCIVCNSDSLVASFSDYPIEVIVGPEVITGSTRMKAGTAQKLVLNMLTTAAMVGLGKVRGNRMTHMQLSNEKLRDRAANMLVELAKIDRAEAEQLLQIHGSVEMVLQHLESR